MTPHIVPRKPGKVRIGQLGAVYETLLDYAASGAAERWTAEAWLARMRRPDVSARDQAAFLADGMEVYLKTFNGAAISIERPARVTLEITETEPVVKGQTASSSYKPATCSNGIRVMVPPHIGAGTRIVINTEDYSYQGRAQD